MAKIPEIKPIIDPETMVDKLTIPYLRRDKSKKLIPDKESREITKRSNKEQLLAVEIANENSKLVACCLIVIC